MNRVEPAKRGARASQGLAALALLLCGAGAVTACATPNSDAAPARTPGAPVQGAPAPAGQDAGTARAPATGRDASTAPAAGQDALRARIRHDENRLHHSFLAHKIALQKQLLATLEDCPGPHCPDAKLAAPATRVCAQRCVEAWAACMGPCTVEQRFCEQHCTAHKRACEDACGPATSP